jgi:hypothetical protein
MATVVTENVDEGRFEITVDSELAGFTEVSYRDGVATFPHTKIDERFGGRGLATELIRSALDEMRRRGYLVRPLCPFVRGFIRKNPEYADLLAH